MTAVAASAGRIGPNAITRVAEVLPALLGEAGTRALFDAAGLGGYLHQPPEGMVDETEVARLHRVLRQQLGPAVAGQVARSSSRAASAGGRRLSSHCTGCGMRRASR